MLVLTRKSDEDILIGNHGEITICVLEIRGSQVWLGIDAPKRIPIHRAEVQKEIERERMYTKEL